MPMSRPAGILAGLGLCTALLACNEATIDDMTAGGGIMTGELECWLRLEFDEPPPGIDPTNVRVVFRSDALEEATEFDWTYIASNDVIHGAEFGSGNRPNAQTQPSTAPPTGEIVKVKFPLYAKRRLSSPSVGALWLEAELWWGGKKQDRSRSDIQRLYRAEDDSSTLPGY